MKRLLLSIAAMTAMTTLSAQRMLVLYYSETGTTKTVAQELQKQTGADIESIECVEPYSGNFQETIQRGQREMQSGNYPALKALKKKELRLFKIYRTIQPILLALAFAGVLLSMAMSVLHFIKGGRSIEWSGFLIRWMTIGFGALSLAYAVAIAWFCNWMAPNFMAQSEKFYSVGVIPPLCLFILMGCALFYSTVRSEIENRKTGK
jgi:hypothetical protein